MSARGQIALPILLIGCCGLVGLWSFWLWGQASPGQTPSAQTYIPQWQIDAGDVAKFEVTSVKQDLPGSSGGYSNVDLTGDDNFAPTGGLFSATRCGMACFVVFAYKLKTYGYYSLKKDLPRWAYTTLYDIEARASGNPTKDQYRLMMQALLADRFKFAAHWELKQTPVMAVVLEKPGNLGPRIRPHSDEVPCPAGRTPATTGATIAGGFPEFCGLSFVFTRGHIHIGARNVSISAITDYLMQDPSERPFIDKTGLNGKYDVVLDWRAADADALLDEFQADATGPSLVEALRNQLGFKLITKTAPVETLVIDHAEPALPN